MQSSNSELLDKNQANVSRDIKYLRIHGASCASCVSKIEGALQAVDGVKGAAMDLAQSTVFVTGGVYDETKRQLDEVEEIVRNCECDIADDWWKHFKEGYCKFVDQNAKDSAIHKAWSCQERQPGR